MNREMTRRYNINALYDCYGNLLTDKQQEIVELYFEEDLSLSEISAVAGISRQAVHNALQRAEEALNQYEAKLGMRQQQKNVDALLESVEQEVQYSLAHSVWNAEKYRDLLMRIQAIKEG